MKRRISAVIALIGRPRARSIVGGLGVHSGQCRHLHGCLKVSITPLTSSCSPSASDIVNLAFTPTDTDQVMLWPDADDDAAVEGVFGTDACLDRTVGLICGTFYPGSHTFTGDILERGCAADAPRQFL